MGFGTPRTLQLLHVLSIPIVRHALSCSGITLELWKTWDRVVRLCFPGLSAVGPAAFQACELFGWPFDAESLDAFAFRFDPLANFVAYRMMLHLQMLYDHSQAAAVTRRRIPTVPTLATAPTFVERRIVVLWDRCTPSPLRVGEVAIRAIRSVAIKCGPAASVALLKLLTKYSTMPTLDGQHCASPKLATSEEVIAMSLSRAKAKDGCNKTLKVSFLILVRSPTCVARNGYTESCPQHSLRSWWKPGNSPEIHETAVIYITVDTMSVRGGYRSH
eukprot:4736232-Amphidinium_carterae.3